MPTYLVNWNPDQWRWKGLPKYVAKSKAGESPRFPWSTGNRNSIEKGDRIFLFRQARDRGIIASGITTSKSYQDTHWDNSKKGLANYVRVTWDAILDVSEVLTVARLEQEDLGVTWSALLGSGVRVNKAKRLETLWTEHLLQIRKGLDNRRWLDPTEVSDDTEYFEGATVRVSVNVYERDPNARQACVDHHGFDCAVCDFNFEDFYGGIGEGFVHVHHLKDLASIAKEHKVDPVKDLRPVCPNCHAMLHMQRPAISIEKLRSVIRRQKAAHAKSCSATTR